MQAELLALDTPCLLLDQRRMDRNIARLDAHLAPLKVALRPHLKTSKCLEIARRLMARGAVGATVSTLREAEVFAASGISSIVYAVGIAPHKLERVHAIRAMGCDLVIILDSLEQAEAVALAAQAMGDRFPTLLEIDCDGHRSGLQPDDPVIIDIARLLIDAGVEFRGVLTHAGESYNARTSAALVNLAEQERSAAVAVRAMLSASGIMCQTVSVGATPTAHFAQDLTGVTEVRAGVYVFFDLVMAGIGVCTTDDIALSVLTTVIGHQRDKGWILVDAGWSALSRDLGTSQQAEDQRYGLVCDVDGHVIPDLLVVQVNQEHGIIAARPGSIRTLPSLPVGTQLRILPVHACATATQFEGYHVINREAGETPCFWPRFRGW